MEKAVDRALTTLRPALDADGFDLRYQGVGADGSIEVVLEARPGACADCLVPDDMIVSLVQRAVAEEGLGAAGVTLVKVGFDEAGH